MIKPTVGRVVLFHPDVDTDRTLAAIVTAVNDDGSINVCAFTEHGHPSPQCDVELLQDGDKKPRNGSFAEWMPFQKGQAAKTEALEKKLEETK